MVSDHYQSPLLDISRLIWRSWRGQLPTGIDRTALAYVAHYRDRAQAVVQRGGFTRVLSADYSRRLFDLLLTPSSDFRRALLRMLPGGLMGTGARDLAGRLYLNVGHTGLDLPGHADWLRRTGVSPIYFIHDLIPLTHPEFCRETEPPKHLRRINALIRNGAGVISNSRATLNELSLFASLQGQRNLPPMTVAPLGVDIYPANVGTAERARLPARPYFVVLGTIEGRKNHLLLLNIWADMARRLGTRCPQLIIIGQRGWESEQTVDMLERCEAIRGHVIELKRCSDDMLHAYLSGARALLFPSFVEGYGLPLVEALGCRTPAIVSDLAVFRELAGEIPEYLSPVDGLGWARMIEDYAQPDSAARAAQVARLTDWRAPDWVSHFDQVERWLGAMLPARRNFQSPVNAAVGAR